MRQELLSRSGGGPGRVPGTVLLVTGTGTGTSPTVALAGIAANARATGRRVAVLVPAEIGRATGERVPSPARIIARLAEPDTLRTLVSYPDALAPRLAARACGLPELVIGDVIEAVEQIAATHDLALIDGGDGLLLPMGENDWTVADLAVALRISAVVVTGCASGALNEVALTFEALARRGIRSRLVVGAWPAQPELVHWANLAEMRGVAGIVPEGATDMSSAQFRAAVPHWFGPGLYGEADPRRLVADAAVLPGAEAATPAVLPGAAL